MDFAIEIAPGYLGNYIAIAPMSRAILLMGRRGMYDILYAIIFYTKIT